MKLRRRNSHLHGDQRLRVLSVIDILIRASRAVTIIEVCGCSNPTPKVNPNGKILVDQNREYRRVKVICTRKIISIFRNVMKYGNMVSYAPLVSSGVTLATDRRREQIFQSFLLFCTKAGAIYFRRRIHKPFSSRSAMNVKLQWSTQFKTAHLQLTSYSVLGAKRSQ